VRNAAAISSKAARDFLARFMLNREVNREFYRLVPAEQYDYHMVDTKTRRSDSPRESLLHQLYVVRNYVYSVSHGVMQWGAERERALMAPALHTWDKKRLLAELDRTEAALIELLSRADIEELRVRVPWQEEPLPALRLLESLIDHEVLHTGWNLALMDHLDIPRFPALREVWGA
jgi:hypothetical protein